MSGDARVWLINLPRSVDRRDVTEKRLAALDLAYELAPGVDGRAEWGRVLTECPILQMRTDPPDPWQTR